MPDTIDRLAKLAGIEPEFWDIFGACHPTSLETTAWLLGGLGFDVGRPQAADASMAAFEAAAWRGFAEPVRVIRPGTTRAARLVIAEADLDKPLAWEIEREDGGLAGGECAARDLVETGRRGVDGKIRVALRLPLGDDLPLGYHRLSARIAGQTGETRLIVAPGACWRPEWLERGGRPWGLNCHLYAARSGDDWGIGDFATLAGLARAGAGAGASAVGINPLHALFRHHPEAASPYSPSSRLFVNPLYIDVPGLPEFAAAAGRLPADLAARVAALRQPRLIDYPGVSALKVEVLEILFGLFADAPPERQAAFAAFRDEAGAALEGFCLHEALSEHFGGGFWHQWPEPYRDHRSSHCQAFAAAHADRLTFFAWLQWLADGQLAAAAAACAEAGMAIGLYRDLAVGINPDGAEGWLDRDLIVEGVRFGAPPDAFSPLGQDWGAPPWNPITLRRRAYGPFIAMLRANMRHAGALRIDHAMSLQHLFWIPRGDGAPAGAYVSYPLDDLLAIVALESHRHRCLVIGEDLGTVPPEFRDHMERESLLSYRVFYFERWPDGLFKRPDAYPRLALATPTTHDLPTLRGHWRGADLAARRELGLFPSPEAMEADEQARARDRVLLVAALVDQGLVEDGFPTGEDLDDARLDRLCLATHRLLARAPSALLLANLDDLTREPDQLNLPGTVHEHPNWCRRVSIAVEDLAGDPFAARLLAALAEERPLT